MKQLVFSVMVATAMTLGASAQEQMTPETLLQLHRIGDSQLSPDGKKVVFQLTTPNVKEDKSSNDLYLVGLDGRGRKALTTTKSGEYSPTWIDGGRRIAFLSNESGTMQLWAIDADGTHRVQLTNIDGGISGYLISPDQKRVAWIKEIKYGKRTSDIYPDLPKATGRIITNQMYKHWDEWVESVPHIFFAELGTEPITSGKDILEGEPYEAPMKPFTPTSDVAWSADSKTIAYASRKKEGLDYTLSTNSDIYLYDTQTGKTRNITEGMMGYDTDPVFSPDGRYISWVSMEHDGYESDLRRLFIQDLQTGEKTYLTEGFECNVENTQWASDSKSIYFLSTVQAEKHIHQITLKGRKIRQITSGQYNYVSFQVEQGRMLAGRQSMTEPTDLYRIDLKKGVPTQITAENATILDKIGEIRVDKRWIKTTDGGQMLVWVLYPKGFDPAKKYPAILYCQGGPQSAISQNFSYRWNFRLMAEQGYIVIAPNRHGVPSFGKAWNEQISGDYPGQNMQDYLTAVDEISKEPFVDKEHIGCVGASYGGFSTYYLAGNHDGRFATFIAHAGIFNMEMQYMTTEEMWFANWDMGGAPWDKNNKVAQRTFEHSPHKFVDKWDKPILVIHGEKDFRILADQGMAAFNAAQMRGIPAEMLIYPDENHWILRPQNSLLWHRTFYSWLDRWLKPAQK